MTELADKPSTEDEVDLLPSTVEDSQPAPAESDSQPIELMSAFDREFGHGNAGAASPGRSRTVSAHVSQSASTNEASIGEAEASADASAGESQEPAREALAPASSLSPEASGQHSESGSQICEKSVHEAPTLAAPSPNQASSSSGAAMQHSESSATPQEGSVHDTSGLAASSSGAVGHHSDSSAPHQEGSKRKAEVRSHSLHSWHDIR